METSCGSRKGTSLQEIRETTRHQNPAPKSLISSLKRNEVLLSNTDSYMNAVVSLFSFAINLICSSVCVNCSNVKFVRLLLELFLSKFVIVHKRFTTTQPAKKLK